MQINGRERYATRNIQVSLTSSIALLPCCLVAFPPGDASSTCNEPSIYDRLVKCKPMVSVLAETDWFRCSPDFIGPPTLGKCVLRCMYDMAHSQQGRQSNKASYPCRMKRLCQCNRENILNMKWNIGRYVPGVDVRTFYLPTSLPR